jgi:hypothetical protein
MQKERLLNFTSCCLRIAPSSSNKKWFSIRIGLVARICRSQSKDDQFRQGRGSIPRFGIFLLPFPRPPSTLVQDTLQGNDLFPNRDKRTTGLKPIAGSNDEEDSHKTIRLGRFENKLICNIRCRGQTLNAKADSRAASGYPPITNHASTSSNVHSPMVQPSRTLSLTCIHGVAESRCRYYLSVTTSM